MRSTLGLHHAAVAVRDRPELARFISLSVVPLVAGLVIGGAVVLIELQGAGAKPAPVGAAVLLGALAAGLAPLRVALLVAAVLSAFEGFLQYFIGGHSTLWEEVFTVVLVARAVWGRPPSRVELSLGGAVALVFLLYALTGTDLKAAGLGAKLLVMFALVGWALVRLEVRRDDWWGLYRGLAIVVAASVVIALWQRHYGVPGLIDLGLRYGESIRTLGGQLRVAGGFVYPAPLGYTLAVAALCWVALVLSGLRREALWTAWVPALAVVGMTLSLSRTAVVAATAATVIVAVVRRGGGGKLLLSGALVAVVIVLVAAPSAAPFLGSGFTGSTKSATQRRDIWSDRASHLSVLGAGPSSVGAAVVKLHPSLNSHPEDDRMSLVLRRGVVDNQYLAWVYQYGWLGGVLICLAWLALLGAVAFSRTATGPAGASAQLVAAFSVIAAVSVNIWEEFPSNLLLALVVGMALGCGAISLPFSDKRPD